MPMEEQTHLKNLINVLNNAHLKQLSQFTASMDAHMYS